MSTAALAVLLLALSAGPGVADDPTVPPLPEATPVETSPQVSPFSQEQVEDAKDALERLRRQRTPAPTPATEVAGPSATSADPSDEGDTGDEGNVISRISDETWWILGAGLLVLLVASETTRVGMRRAKHRKA